MSEFVFIMTCVLSGERSLPFGQLVCIILVYFTILLNFVLVNIQMKILRCCAGPISAVGSVSSLALGSSQV